MRDSLYDKRVFILTSAALSWLTFIGNSWTTRPNIFLKSNLQVKADLHFQPFSILIFFFSYSRFSKKNFESHLVKLDDSYQQNFGLVQSQIYNCKVEFWAREIESVDLPRSVDRFLENSSNFWNIFHLLNSCRFMSWLKILKSAIGWVFQKPVQIMPMKFVNEGWGGLRTQILGLWILR